MGNNTIDLVAHSKFGFWFNVKGRVDRDPLPLDIGHLAADECQICGIVHNRALLSHPGNAAHLDLGTYSPPPR